MGVNNEKMFAALKNWAKQVREGSLARADIEALQAALPERMRRYPYTDFHTRDLKKNDVDFACAIVSLEEPYSIDEMCNIVETMPSHLQARVAHSFLRHAAETPALTSYLDAALAFQTQPFWMPIVGCVQMNNIGVLDKVSSHPLADNGTAADHPFMWASSDDPNRAIIDAYLIKHGRPPCS
jgi:hypothetical protein